LAARATPLAAMEVENEKDTQIDGMVADHRPDLGDRDRAGIRVNQADIRTVIEPGNKSNARMEVRASKRDAAPNTRGNAQQAPRVFDALENQIPGQMPEQFDLATGWEDLWRIEKDGETRYRWRLRFTADRRGRPGGKITPEIRRKLKKRPGKGRHADSRQAAERLRRRAGLIAERLRASDRRRDVGKSNRTDGDDRRSPNTRIDNPPLEREQMPGLRELDNWPEMPDVLM